MISYKILKIKSKRRSKQKKIKCCKISLTNKTCLIIITPILNATGHNKKLCSVCFIYWEIAFQSI